MQKIRRIDRHKNKTKGSWNGWKVSKMKEWKVKDIRRVNGRTVFPIFGENLREAVETHKDEIARSVNEFNDCQIQECTEVRVEWSDSIFGGKGGVKAIIKARVNTAYTKDSEKYKEYHKIFEGWVYACKDDLACEN